uniref:Uncharacterized protein n=1 Tax=Timema monikensis TaxID=170555 RepID=A0A7R9HLF2_9NEOP|nr:unnamed protein product [Timema monikensis]
MGMAPFQAILLKKSCAESNYQIANPRYVAPPKFHLPFNHRQLDWDDFHWLRKKGDQVKQTYRSKVRRAHVDDARDYWSTILSSATDSLLLSSVTTLPRTIFSEWGCLGERITSLRYSSEVPREMEPVCSVLSEFGGFRSIPVKEHSIACPGKLARDAGFSTSPIITTSSRAKLVPTFTVFLISFSASPVICPIPTATPFLLPSPLSPITVTFRLPRIS